MPGAVYVNGRLSGEADAVVPVFDHGFLYGEGVYEVCRTYRGRVRLLARHLSRLRASAALIALSVPFDDAALGARIDETLAAAALTPWRDGVPDAYVRLLLTRGVGELSYDPRALPDAVAGHHRAPAQPAAAARVRHRRAGRARRRRAQSARSTESADQVEQPAEQRPGDAAGIGARRVRGRDAQPRGPPGRVQPIEPLCGQRAVSSARRRLARACCRASRARSCWSCARPGHRVGAVAFSTRPICWMPTSPSSPAPRARSCRSSASTAATSAVDVLGRSPDGSSRPFANALPRLCDASRYRSLDPAGGCCHPVGAIRLHKGRVMSHRNFQRALLGASTAIALLISRRPARRQGPRGRQCRTEALAAQRRNVHRTGRRSPAESSDQARRNHRRFTARHRPRRARRQVCGGPVGATGGAHDLDGRWHQRSNPPLR